MSYYQTPPGKDPQLWQLAQRRASFKTHLCAYVIVNLSLWLLWIFSGDRTAGSGFPWPVWPLMGWGIGLASHYVSAYVNTGTGSVDKEYEKLLNHKNNQSTI